MKKYIKLMRPKHYIKNCLIFLPLLFSGQLLQIDLLCKVLYAFAAFSLISSVVYIVNDIRDVESDCIHPTKCNRPIANGSISITSAYALATILLLIVIGINVFFFAENVLAWIIVAIYFMLNLSYSFGLKNIPIVDIAILVSGFLLRVIYGSATTGIEISSWLYLTVIAMSFYLGLGKRRGEITKQSDGSTRKVLQIYNYSFLDKNMYMCLALTIVFYSLWTVDALTVARLDNNNLVWTVPLVILICMKYSLTVEGNSDGDPVEVIFQDKCLIGLILLFGVAVMGIIYF